MKIRDEIEGITDFYMNKEYSEKASKELEQTFNELSDEKCMLFGKWLWSNYCPVVNENQWRKIGGAKYFTTQDLLKEFKESLKLI